MFELHPRDDNVKVKTSNPRESYGELISTYTFPLNTTLRDGLARSNTKTKDLLSKLTLHHVKAST